MFLTLVAIGCGGAAGHKDPPKAAAAPAIRADNERTDRPTAAADGASASKKDDAVAAGDPVLGTASASASGSGSGSASAGAEAPAADARIALAYRRLLGRDASEQEVAAIAADIAAGRSSVGLFIVGLTGGEEFLARLGGDAAVSAESIRKAFQILLGREASAADVDGWLAATTLQGDRNSRFALRLLAAAEFRGKQADLLAARNLCGLHSGDTTDQSMAIAACVNLTTAEAAFQHGLYFFDRPLVLEDREGLTLTTDGVAPDEPACYQTDDDERCAIFVASQRLVPAPTNGAGGPILLGERLKNMEFRHIGFHGQNAYRNAGLVAWGDGTMPSNVWINACDHCRFIGVASAYAAKSSGMVLHGPDNSVERCLFRDNGLGANRSAAVTYADGLTVPFGPRISIKDSVFLNNSDGNLVLGGVPGGRVNGNKMTQRSGTGANYAVSGIDLENFKNPELSDQTGLVIDFNVINGGDQDLLGVGIEAGPYLWYRDSGRMRGFTLRGNQVHHSRQGIMIFGADDATIANNAVETSGGWIKDGCTSSRVDITLADRIAFDGNGGIAAATNSWLTCGPLDFLSARKP